MQPQAVSYFIIHEHGVLVFLFVPMKVLPEPSERQQLTTPCSSCIYKLNCCESGVSGTKEYMKVRSLLTFILTLLVCVGVDAKEVKLSKNIIFEGEVSSKVPTGRGTLKLMAKNPRNNNDEEFITIHGNYSGSEITEIYVGGKGKTGDMCFKHATYTLDAKENALSITFKGFYEGEDFTDRHKIIGNNDEYRFDFVFDKKIKSGISLTILLNLPR